MTIYCSANDDKATIIWQWTGEDKKKYESSKVPVQVDISSVNITGDSNMGTWSMRTYDTKTLPPGNPLTYRGTSTESPVTINTREIRTSGTNRLIYQDGSVSAGAIQYLDIQFTPDPTTKYRITISDINGNQLFQEEKQADSPPKYEVACGNGCPSGYHKCNHDKYPGYCCIPCVDTADKIRNLASKLGKK
ncbi:hypothetical protein I8748_05540 [Nostoc sp. CENA67]|uniref:Uncharacterized protein n=1 Tax=Amazonocrinis nigriterrae CENA67 TaxID=2794033 RepID=A0A8J7L841_9NOST|nr:hypothetical protein [Amazonocrinis nigriterrae]MBH8561646.1 hypothetical protein [Amazonocrinis nigriterrae CENA67]